jgi:eukaryotic-like serine/threonine-protein kinase
MALSPGTKLGPYEILAPLGAGGMGEVYRAKDTRLDRTIAIKILPAQLSADPASKQRFEREAKAISALNHPNICVLYDVGNQDGIEYLVMECLEGETLAKRLERGALPTEQVLKIGTEIADGLDKAHRSGVVHRDLKPGNIMLTKTGAKLLDFGLAKSTVSAASALTMTAAAGSSPVTQEGMIVGTFQYMSPEQVEGKELDGRSDLFSLGAVLYEMLTGNRAFDGKSQLSVASAILEKEPAPISTIKPLTPRNLDHIVRRCLAKDPDDRWQYARDLALELKAVSSLAPSFSQSGVALPVSRRKNAREFAAWSVAALALLATTFLLLRPSSKSLSAAESINSSILPPDQLELVPETAASISPDGRFLVFSAAKSGFAGQLWLRRLDSSVTKPLAGTDEAENPFWSPDSRWIAFTSGGKLEKISVDGGTPLEICYGGSNRGGTWSTDGTILFVPGFASPVYSVSANGGTPQPVTQIDKTRQEITHRWPQFLPDRKHFIFFARGPENSIYVGSLGSTERKLILKNSTNAVYSPPGFLLFQRNGNLMAQPFDAQRLELSGAPMSIAEDVATYNVWQRALFSTSNSGHLVFQARINRLLQPVWADRSGKILEPLSEPSAIIGSDISHNGQKIVFVIDDPHDDTTNIWSYDVRSRVRTRLTFERPIAYFPIWSPDDTRIDFASNRLGLTQVFSIPSSGMGQVEHLFSSDEADSPTSWSPNGRYLALNREPGGDQAKQTIWIHENFGEQKLYPLLATSHPPEYGAVFSPDGKWIAYQSNESGRTEIYITPFPGANVKIQVSTGLNFNPKWSRDGKELFYVTEDNTITVASLEQGKAGLHVARTTPLFKVQPANFEVSPDGQHILIYKSAEKSKPSSITLITNWPSLLSKK